MKKIGVFIVEDSRFFVKRISSIINDADDMELLGIAENGLEAVSKVKELDPDVITMDVSMPLLSGIDAVKQIMATSPSRILMLSAHTVEGASDTFEALRAGAVDFISKDVDNFTKNIVADKIRAVAVSNLSQTSLVAPQQDLRKSEQTPKTYNAIVIGASTGGPVALESILSGLPKEFNIPILVVMHFPEGFATQFAQRMDENVAIKVTELENNTFLEPGVVYITPGNTEVYFKNKRCYIKDADPNTIYKPNIDIAFSTAAESFAEHLLAIVLTGMGADGAAGAKDIMYRNGTVWIQSEDTCIVSGMSNSVRETGAYDLVVSLPFFADKLRKLKPVID